MVSLKKLLNSWFDEIFFQWEFLVFPHYALIISFRKNLVKLMFCMSLDDKKSFHEIFLSSESKFCVSVTVCNCELTYSANLHSFSRIRAQLELALAMNSCEKVWVWSKNTFIVDQSEDLNRKDRIPCRRQTLPRVLLSFLPSSPRRERHLRQQGHQRQEQL